MWPRVEGSVPTASVSQTADFIANYQRAAGREWDPPDVQDAWAASLWVGLTFAKQDAAEGGSEHVGHLARDIDERLHRAALD